jgi:hypothetical protein
MNSLDIFFSCVLPLVCVSLPLASGVDSTTPAPSADVLFAISGENELNSGSHVWDNPIVFYDGAYFDVAALLNSLSRATPPPPPPLTNMTTTPQPEEEGLAVWVIIVISVGGAILLVGLAVGTWFACRHAAAARVYPANEGHHSRMGFSNRVYPPPHAYSKVIQVPLVNHQLHCVPCVGN